MPFSAPVLTYRAKGLASNIQSKVLKVHNTLININITAISAPVLTNTPVFLGVLQTAMAKKAGNGLDIGTIVEDVNSEGMAAHMPTDVFFSSEKVQKVLILGC